MADNKKIAADVLEAVGGKENVTFVAHCMTRLRFNLKDIDAPDIKKIKKINGVLGAQISGSQFQVIVGQNVPNVYDELCKLGGFAKQDAVDENLDKPKEKLTPKAIGNNILNYLSSSMVPMIPVMMCAGLFKTIAVVLGPTMANVIAETSDLYVLMNMVYDAAFYFIPIYLGYNAAKNIGVTPVLGAFMGGILIDPTMIQLAADGAPFSVYGIPCVAGNYAQSVTPILLSVWAMSYIERLFKKVMPDTLSTVFTPFFTMLVTVPVSLCALAPLGSWLGNGLAAFFEMLGSTGGVVAILGAGLLAAAWLPIVISGMHVALIMIAIANFMATGVDSFILPATTLSLWAAYGAEVASWLKLRNKDEKTLCLGYVIANMVGGVGEPFIYGVMLRYRRTFAMAIAGAFVAGALGMSLGVSVYVAGTASNVLNLLAFVGGDVQNFINACIAGAVGFIAAFALTFFFGFTEDELENGPVSER